MNEKRERRPRPDSPADGMIEGRNAVIEALRVGTNMDKIMIARGETDATLGHIASKAREKGIVVVDVDRRKLDYMSQTHAHQGVIAVAAVREYVSVDDILAVAAERGESPLLVICDEISDPHNLGAIIRTAECAGAHGVIIPKRRDLRHGGRRGGESLSGGPEGPCGHRHRLRGQRHEPSGGGELRFHRQHPHEGQAQFPQRLGLSGDFAL